MYQKSEVQKCEKNDFGIINFLKFLDCVKNFGFPWRDMSAFWKIAYLTNSSKCAKRKEKLKYSTKIKPGVDSTKKK